MLLRGFFKNFLKKLSAFKVPTRPFLKIFLILVKIKVAFVKSYFVYLHINF